ncbi:MAG: SpoIIE family protein phosphatase [Bacteroidetes bacterium]|jgi:hypothetical protein|nr:SpoIIE family protein phosphatase [Bacteroidota bacterium]
MTEAPPLPDLPDSAATDDDVLYVADHDLRIVHVNDGWRSFASNNGGERVLGDGWNPHVLDNFSGSERTRWQAIYRALLNGQLPEHEEEFICPSPVERRLYKLRITPRRDDDGDVAFLVHHAVRIDKNASDADEGESPDPEQAIREDAPEELTLRAYRAYIVEQDIRLQHVQEAHAIRPLEEAGGDFLWRREYDSGICDIVMGDAMGHGLDAARTALRVVLTLDDLVADDRTLEDTIQALNRSFFDGSAKRDDATFATGLYLRLLPRKHCVYACSFGHNNPIFSRSGRLPIEGGMPVGLVPTDDVYPAVPIDLDEHGTRFLTYTDGVTEQFNPAGDMFGEDRLEAVFAATLNQSLADQLRTILRTLESYRGAALTKDDQTLLAIECEPAGEAVSS